MTEYNGEKSSRKTKRSAKRRFLFRTIIILFIIFAALLYDSNTRMVTTEYTVESARLPEGFDGYRIVQLSDLHGAEFGEDNEELISAVRTAVPDIIAVTGDIIDSTDDLDYVKRTISALAEIAPVYYVTGNHEWGCGAARKIFSIIDDIDNAHYLRNTFITLEKGGDKIILAGMDDPNGLRDQKTLPEVREKIRSSGYDGFILMLAHRNDMATYERQDIDLVLTGHAHGGLIRLPFTDGIINAERQIFPENTSGLCPVSGGGYMLVSRGMGNSSISLRLFNNPEMTVTVLKTK